MMPQAVSEPVAQAMPSGIVAFLRGESMALSNLECELLVAIGAQAYQQERYGDAAAMFRAFVLARPKSARAWCLLAMCHDAVEDFERADPLYGVASLAPEQREVTDKVAVYHARTLCRLDRFDEAATILDRLEELPSELDDVRRLVRREIEEALR